MIEFALLNMIIICSDINITAAEIINYRHNIVAGNLLLGDAIITVCNGNRSRATADKKSYFVRLALCDNHNLILLPDTGITVDIAAENRGIAVL